MSDRPLTFSFLADREPSPRHGRTGPNDLPRGNPALRQPRMSVMAALRLVWSRYRSRVKLAQLDGRLLRDIGVTYAEAEHEANKPFWRA